MANNNSILTNKLGEKENTTVTPEKYSYNKYRTSHMDEEGNNLMGGMAIQHAAIVVASDLRTFGNVFANNSYKVIVLSPQLLYGFYKDCNTVGCLNTSGQMLSVATTEAIDQLIMSPYYIVLNAEIKAVDSLASYNNGVLVSIIGSITFKNSGTRTFTRSFFLGPQKSGYFVLNDVVRYLDEESKQLKQGNLPKRHQVRKICSWMRREPQGS